MEQAPSLPGTYALHLLMEETSEVQVGRLGMVEFPSGSYIYLGSARGPGGLRARLRHHLYSETRPHWHIDQLRPYTSVRGYCYILSKSQHECRWSSLLASHPTARVPVPDFGASDCRAGCPAHLILMPLKTSLVQLHEILQSNELQQISCTN